MLQCQVFCEVIDDLSESSFQARFTCMVQAFKLNPADLPPDDLEFFDPLTEVRSDRLHHVVLHMISSDYNFEPVIECLAVAESSGTKDVGPSQFEPSPQAPFNPSVEIHQDVE